MTISFTDTILMLCLLGTYVLYTFFITINLFCYSDEPTCMISMKYKYMYDL